MDKEKLFSQIPVLSGKLVSLHSVQSKDGEQLFNIYKNKQVFKYCGILNKNNKQTVVNMIPHFERDFKKKNRIKWGIYLNKNGLMVGIIEIMDINQNINMLTIGYYLAEEHWNKGYATQAVSILLDFLFSKINLNRIQAYVMPENTYSKKVLLKNGFIKEGLIRQGASWPGKGIIDLELYSILKTEYFSHFPLYSC